MVQRLLNSILSEVVKFIGLSNKKQIADDDDDDGSHDY